MKNSNFFAELKRRNVYKVAIAYVVAGWAFAQGIAQVLPVFDIPNSVVRWIVLLIIIGLPIALGLAWTFELTPEGIKRTGAADGAGQHSRGNAWLYIAIAGVVVSIGLFFVGRYSAGNGTPRQDASAARTEAATVPSKSIAVLPFDSLSEDKSNAYFAEGVQDEILTRLAKVADLKVISRTSTQRFKSAPANLPDIAKQLGVANILEGSVQKASDQVRVNVQLIQASTDTHLWADSYDRKLTDIFAVESEIARTIADNLQAKLTGREKRAIAARPTEDPEAYQLYLQGRFFWSKRNAADLRRAIDYFDQAIAKDPNYALAYALLAQTLTLLPSYNGGDPTECWIQSAGAARKALELDPTSSEALIALASYKNLYEFDFSGALKEYERIIQLDPNNATAHHWLAIDVLGPLGQTAREIAEMKRALELDPLSLIINSNLGLAYLHARRLDEASAQLRKTIEMDRSFYVAQHYYAMVLGVQSKVPEAITQCEKAIAITNDPFTLGILGRLYGMAGRKAEAGKILEQLRASRSQHYEDAYALSLAALGFGDKAEAVHWLEQAYHERDSWIEYIRIDPLLAPLHGDPRFEALAEKIVPAREFGEGVTQR
jgi:TolB-like protein/Tfp pilus assembly protein PilF